MSDPESQTPSGDRPWYIISCNGEVIAAPLRQGHCSIKNHPENGLVVQSLDSADTFGRLYDDYRVESGDQQITMMTYKDWRNQQVVMMNHTDTENETDLTKATEFAFDLPLGHVLTIRVDSQTKLDTELKEFVIDRRSNVLRSATPKPTVTTTGKGSTPWRACFNASAVWALIGLGGNPRHLGVKCICVIQE